MKGKNGIIIIRPNDEAEVVYTSVDMTLEFMQSIVGGYIEVLRLKRGLVLVMDEDGKLKANPRINRIATELARLPYDVVVGTTFLCREEGEQLLPLTPEQLEGMTELLKAYRPCKVTVPKPPRSLATPRWDFRCRRWRVQTCRNGKHVNATGRTAQEAREKLERKLELLEAGV